MIYSNQYPSEACSAKPCRPREPDAETAHQIADDLIARLGDLRCRRDALTQEIADLEAKLMGAANVPATSMPVSRY